MYDAPGGNRVHGRKRDHSDHTEFQQFQSRSLDMRFVRSVQGRSAFERAHLGGAEPAAEEDLSHTAARLDGRGQAAGPTRRREIVQVRNRTRTSVRPAFIPFCFSRRFFTQLPTNYYLEITQMLLTVASEDIQQGNEIKTAVKVNASSTKYLIYLTFAFNFPSLLGW